MMDWVRKNVSLIAGITVGVTVLWLVGTAVSIRSTQADVAGTLFGKKVMVQAYQQSLNAVTRQAILNHGDKFREEVTPEELDQMAWQRLTLLEEAKRRRIEVTDKDVVNYLQNWPLFQRDGQFDPPSYEALIRYSLGTTPRQFEEEIRGMLMIVKLTEGAITTNVTDNEVAEAYQQTAETVKVSYLAVPEEAAAKEIAQSARQNPSMLDSSAQQLGIPVKTIDFFSRDTNLPGIGIAGEALEPVFPLAIGETTGPVQTSLGWLVLRVDAKMPADMAKFDEKKATLRKELEDRKKLTAYVAWYSELLKRADLKKSLPEEVAPAARGRQNKTAQPPQPKLPAAP